MHHLVIGEGQIGQAVIAEALRRGDDVTVLRRSAVTHEESAARYGSGAEKISRITGGVGNPSALREAAAGADTVQACFHGSAYDSRQWRRELPAMERATLDAAAREQIPVAFPESMYAFVGGAEDLREGAAFSPLEGKGKVRAELIDARRAHAARTVSVVASDLIGPTCLGTNSAVSCTTVIEPLAAGGRPYLPGAPRSVHSLTVVDDLAVAMLLAATEAEALAESAVGGGEGTDAVVHAPTDDARTPAELAAVAAERLHARHRRLIALPRLAVRTAGIANRLMYELGAIGDLWYRDCRMRPGVLTTHYGLAPTPWDAAVAETVDAAATRVPLKA